MNPFKKALVSVAAPSKKYNHSLDKRHTTTSDFFQLDCAYFKECVPDEHVNVSMRTEARLAAMTLPSFVDVNLHQRAFFVPTRIIFPAWQDFITDTNHVTANSLSGLVQSVPKFTNQSLVSVLINPIFSQVQDHPENVDFSVYSGSAAPFTITHYNFTSKGRHFYKILRQLGYQVMFDDRLNESDKDRYYSALPLLAYAKVYCDWYFPSQYGSASDKTEVEKIFKRDSSLNPILSAADILNIALYCGQVPYDADYFTSAFDNPVGPNVGNYTSTTITDITSNGSNTSAVFNSSGSSSTPTNGTPFIRQDKPSAALYTGPLTQYILDALKSLSDYAKRHQLAGSQAFARFLARWGVEMKDSHRSVYIGSDSVPLIVSDVMSTAETETTISTQQDPTAHNTDGANLGDYSGKGRILQQDSFNFDFDTNGDHGFIIVMTSLVPRVGYVQGIRRHCLHINKLDFATPEFDALGNRAILSSELYVPTDGTDAMTPTIFSTTFGFTPQYSEYKTDFDTLSGDFACASINQAGFTSNAWHHARLFNTSSFGEVAPVHSLSFVMPNDAQQYDRIFSYAPEIGYLGVRADHFVLTHMFNVNVRNNLKPLFDTYEFKDEEESRKVELPINGKTLN